MIGNKQEISKDLEKALQVLQQAKQRVANEKKKQNEKKRKAENHHKRGYIPGSEYSRTRVYSPAPLPVPLKSNLYFFLARFHALKPLG